MKHILIILLLIGCKDEVIQPKPQIDKATYWTFIGKFKVYEYITHPSSIQTIEYNVNDTFVMGTYKPIDVLVYSEKPTDIKVLKSDSVYYQGVTDRLRIKSK